MPPPDWITNTDPLNFSTVKLETYFNETKLGDATGFFVHLTDNGTPTHRLVTNWHVLTGRNAESPDTIIHQQGAIPNRIRMSLTLKPDQPEYEGDTTKQLMQEVFIQLFNDQGRAEWAQHAEKNKFDVALVSPPAASLNRYHIVGVNEISQRTNMSIEIGNEVFILGFPLGFTHLTTMPIWKRGSIATDPNFETPETGPKVVIDATTRGGMSGSPVIMRAKTHYVSTGGQTVADHNATRWIGIYSSRPTLAPGANVGEEDKRAEVGYFFKNGCVIETIEHGIRGPDFGAMP